MTHFVKAFFTAFLELTILASETGVGAKMGRGPRYHTQEGPVMLISPLWVWELCRD